MGRVSTCPAPNPPRLETRSKKPVYCPTLFVSTGTRLTRPDLIFIFIFFFPLNFMQWAEAQKQEGEVPATRHQSSLGPLGWKLKN